MKDAIRGFTDAPLIDLQNEHLGLAEYAEALADFISTCETPMTISLQGDWGTGKTTLMKFIERHLKNKEENAGGQFRCLTFNTWQYSQLNLQNDLELILLSMFAEKLGAEPDLKQMILSFGKKIIPTLASFAGGALLKEGAEKFREVLEENEDYGKKIVTIKEGLEKTVKNIVEGNGGMRVVVFVDDLDRLVPLRAVEVLECLKLFLDIPGCVFVLAVDYHVVMEGFSKKFEIPEVRLNGKSFFDKIIQLPFNMPVASYHTEKLIKNLLERMGVSPSDPLQEAERYTELAESSVGCNPRTLKRLFNSLLLQVLVAQKKKIIKGEGGGEDADAIRVLFASLCLQHYHPPFYHILLKNGDLMSDETMKEMRTAEGIVAIVKKCGFAESDMQLGVVGWDKILASFMDSFYKAAQFASDGNSEKLSESECKKLKELFSLSAATAGEVGEGYDVEYYHNLEFIKMLVEEINEWLSKEAKEKGWFPTILFKKHKPRSSPDAGLYLYNNELDFQMYFSFGSTWGNYFTFGTSTKSGVDERVGWVKEYFVEHIPKKYKEMEYDKDNNWEFAFIRLGDYSRNQSQENQENEEEFKRQVKELCSSLLPRYFLMSHNKASSVK